MDIAALEADIHSAFVPSEFLDMRTRSAGRECGMPSHDCGWQTLHNPATRLRSTARGPLLKKSSLVPQEHKNREDWQ